FGNVGAGVGDEFVNLLHRLRASLGFLLPGKDIRLVPGNTWKRRGFATSQNEQREGVQNLWVGGGVPCGRNRIGRGTGQAFVEMQGETPLLARGEQRLGQVISTRPPQERSWQPRRAICMDVMPRLIRVAGPYEVVSG